MKQIDILIIIKLYTFLSQLVIKKARKATNKAAKTHESKEEKIHGRRLEGKEIRNIRLEKTK